MKYFITLASLIMAFHQASAAAPATCQLKLILEAAQAFESKSEINYYFDLLDVAVASALGNKTTITFTGNGLIAAIGKTSCKTEFTFEAEADYLGCAPAKLIDVTTDCQPQESK